MGRHEKQERYSSLQCTGGVQPSIGYDPRERENSVCMLENVCWHDGKLEYYHDVEESLEVIAHVRERPHHEHPQRLSLISHAFLVAQCSGGCCDRVCVKAHNKDCSNR